MRQLRRRSARSGQQLAAAIRAPALEPGIRAGRTEGALERADPSQPRVRWQVPIAAFATGAQFKQWPSPLQDSRLASCGHDSPGGGRGKGRAGIAIRDPTWFPAALSSSSRGRWAAGLRSGSEAPRSFSVLNSVSIWDSGGGGGIRPEARKSSAQPNGLPPPGLRPFLAFAVLDIRKASSSAARTRIPRMAGALFTRSTRRPR